MTNNPEKKHPKNKKSKGSLEKHPCLKRAKRIFLSLPIQLGIIVFAFLLGFFGYLWYYTLPETVCLTNRVVQSLFSTIKLFALSFDANTKNLVQYGTLTLAVILEVARWLALFISGTALLRLLKPLFARWQQDAIFRRWRRRNQKILLIGNNPDNKKIYDSAQEKRQIIVVCDTESEKPQDPAMWKGYPCANADGRRVAVRMVKEALRNPKQEGAIVIHTCDEKRNLLICKSIVDAVQDVLGEDFAKYEKAQKNIKDLKKDKKRLQEDKATAEALGRIEMKILEHEREKLAIERKVVPMLNRLHVTVFGDQRYEELYLQLQRDSKDILRYANKYLLTAFNFVFRYPLTRHLEKGWIKNGCVDADVDFNVIFLGFGDTNANIYSAHRTVNQFIVQPGPRQIPAHKKVNYYIIDRKGAEDNGLNYADLRYEQEFCDDIKDGLLKKEDYLPLPDKPAMTDYFTKDFNSRAFYQFIREIVTKNEKSINEIIICVGDDMDNIDLAQKLAVKKKEWGVTHFNIYAKVREWGTYKEGEGTRKQEKKNKEGKKKRGDDRKAWEFAAFTDANVRKPNYAALYENDQKAPGFTPFGNEATEVFRLNTIWQNPIIEMARKRNVMYMLADFNRNELYEKDEDVENRANYTWYTMDPNKQNSNIYAALSLRFKMQLMGINFHLIRDDEDDKGSENRADQRSEVASNEEYMAIYAKGDDFVYAGKTYNGMKLIDYNVLDNPKVFERDILRRNLAVQEHLRWNAYTMSCGFIPASKKQMREMKCHQDYARRIHGNLTPFEGLFEYRELMAEIKNSDESQEDVIRYDYQLMDTAWCFLHENGFRVHKRWG